MYKTIRPILYMVILLLLQVSCKKELKCKNAIQLTDERTSFLVGEWEWEYTIRRVLDKGTGNTVEDTIYNFHKSDVYKVIFEKEGKITLLINQKESNKFCIVDSAIVNDYYPNKTIMNLYLENNENEESLTFTHNKNSNIMRLGINGVNFPYSYEETDQEQIFYGNYFTKQ